jgi:hypothetical protein
MSRILAVSYNTGSTITGTLQYGNIAVGNIAQDYSGRPGNVDWWASPDLDLRYVIGYEVPSCDHPTPIPGVTACLGFWGSQELTENSFLTLSNKIPPRKNETPFTTAEEAYSWLVGNGYWTSFEPTLPSNTIDFGTTLDQGSLSIDYIFTASTISDQDIRISFKTILNFDIDNVKFDLDQIVTIPSGQLTGQTTVTLTSVIPEDSTIGRPLDYSDITKGLITITDISANRPNLTFNKYAYVNFVGHTPNFGEVIFVNCCRDSVNPQYVTVLVDSKKWLTEDNIIVYNGSCYTYLEPGDLGPVIGYYYGPDYSRGCGFVLCEDCEPEPTPSVTPTNSQTPTPSVTIGSTPTPTPTNTETPTPTPTPTTSPIICSLGGDISEVTCSLDGDIELLPITPTPTPTPTRTVLGATLVPVDCEILGDLDITSVVVSSTPTPTPTITPTPNPTPTPTLTITSTPTPTPTSESCDCYVNITINYSCRTGICPSSIGVEHYSCDGSTKDTITVDMDIPFTITKCVDSKTLNPLVPILSNYSWEYDYSSAIECCER